MDLIHAVSTGFNALYVRWAVKEAAYKALFGIGKLTWKDMTFTSGKDVTPSLNIYLGKLPLHHNLGPVHVSVSHDGEYVVAMVVAESRST